MQLFEEQLRPMDMPELCRQRLLHYADSFNCLARSFDREFMGIHTERAALLEEHKQWENRQIVGMNLKEMAMIMDRMARDLTFFTRLEEKKEKLLFHALRKEDILPENAYYMPAGEDRRILALTLKTAKKRDVAAEKVAELISVLFRKKVILSVNSPYYVEDTGHTFLFMEEPRFTVLTGYARATKESEEISGDNYSVLETERGQLSILLSDGTGSGEGACEDSGRVLDLMEKLLDTGYDPYWAILMINFFVFAGENQISHPTLDLCQMNLYQGDCCFYKVGGACTYICRQGQIRRILGGSLPLGFFRDVEVRKEEHRLRDGDFLIFLTDGVVDALQKEGQEDSIAQILKSIECVNPKSVAKVLMEQAILLSGGHIKDDMTIVVAGVWEKAGKA